MGQEWKGLMDGREGSDGVLSKHKEDQEPE